MAAQRPKPRGRTTAKSARRAKSSAGQKPPRSKARTERAKSGPASRPSKAALAGPAALPRVPNAIGLINHHLDYTSHDMGAVKQFYTLALGFAQAQHDPATNYLHVQTGASSSIGFMPPMPGPPEQWRPPREPALYFIVADVDQAHQELVSKGIVFEQAPKDMPWGHRIAWLRDPEGRTVCLAQVLRG